jgi:hypothetical protein
MGRTAEMLIEYMSYDRPRRLASITTMRKADISYTLTFEPAGAGARMRWSGQVHPTRAVRLLGSLITWLRRRQERRISTSLKRYLENTAARPVTRPAPWPGHGGPCRTCSAKKARTRCQESAAAAGW